MNDIPEQLIALAPGREAVLSRAECAPLEPVEQQAFFAVYAPDERWFYLRKWTDEQVYIYRLSLGEDDLDRVMLWFFMHCPMDETFVVPRRALPKVEPIERTPYLTVRTIEGEAFSYMIEAFDDHWATIRRIEPTRLPPMEGIEA